MVGDLEYPRCLACLPRQGKSLPDTGRSLQSCIFIVQESSRRYSPATRTPPNPGFPQGSPTPGGSRTPPWRASSWSAASPPLLLYIPGQGAPLETTIDPLD